MTKKEEMKRVVIDALTEEFKKPSEHDDIIAFSKGLAEGREMQLMVITGGLCNMSYKLKFKDSTISDVVLFVKLTFGTPVTFPDVPCSHERTNYEFKAMEMFAKVTPYPESAVNPYILLDVKGSEENMKIIVTQYSSRLEEQAGNLFVDGGAIDKEFATKIAKSLVALHNTEVTEPDFNGEIKEFFTSILGVTQLTFDGYLDESNKKPNRTALAGRVIGKEGLDKIIEETTAHILQTDCYVHGDCHMFNILVANKLEASMSDSVGDMAIIDWEFAHCGPAGKDLGWVQVFPIACALTHAINGETSNSKSILEFCETVWETYEAELILEGKEFSIEDVYRSVVASLGIMFGIYSSLGIHCEYLPIEEGNTEDLEKVKDSLGVLSLECFEMGYLNKYEGASLADLRKHFKDAVQAEMDLLSPAATRRSKRASILRTKGKRVSDAHSYFSIATEEDIEKALDMADGNSVKSEGEDQFSMSDSDLLGSDLFSSDSSSELRNIYFGEPTEKKSPMGGRASSRMSNRISIRMSRMSARSSRMSMLPRVSLAITDLKRKSIGEWDRMILDFEWDDDEE